MTPELLDRSEELFRRRREVEDTEQWRQLSDEFLKTFYGPAQRPITVELLKNVTDQALRYWHAILPMRKSASTVGTSFLDVIAACRQGNLDLALARISEAHQGSIQLITQFFADRAPSDK
jgi:DNA-binding GntR family transcriptional regulator